MVKMIDIIDTEALEKNVTKWLPTAMTKGSVLTDLGAQAIGNDVDNMKWLSFGGAAAVHEGAEKPLSSIGVNEKDIYKTTLVQMFTTSKKATSIEAGRAMMDEAIVAALASFAPSGDIVMISGTSADTGAAIADLADIHIAGNANQHFHATGDFDKSVAEAMKANSAARSMALSDKGFAEYAYIETPSGLVKYPLASQEDVFNHRWLRTKVAPAVGQKAWSADGTVVENDLLGLVGDFSQIVRAISNVSIDESRDATVGGRSMFTHNEIVWRVECDLHFAIKDLSKITAIHDAR